MSTASTISILPEPLANKIAAGEVVQRPANAVKELIENAVDAEATSITVVVRNGGKTLIQVVDDGVGMGRDDAQLAFARHATSKIRTYEDLEHIRTLGFRGEALAAISAVAQVELRTRRSESDVGTLVHVEGGSAKKVSACAAAQGTSVLVKNLYYNTPARRHFLRSDATEFKHIHDVVQRVAISSPSLAMKFVSDDETILNLRPTTPMERIKDLFGEKLAGTLFQFEQGSDLMRVSGFLGRPDFARKSRIEQYLYLNNRSIINRSINHAVFQAYEHLLEKGSFPFFILFLTLDPEKVDVNVHPAKMEVKFEDETAVYRWVMSSVRKSLTEHDLVPSLGMREATSHDENMGLRYTQGDETARARITPWGTLLQPGQLRAEPTAPGALTGLLAGVGKFADDDPAAGLLPDSALAATPPSQMSQTSAPASRPSTPNAAVSALAPQVWQIHNKYLMVMVEGGVMLIDQHAAHERVIYERASVRFREHHTQSQQLLFPYTIEMTGGDAALIGELKPLLEEIGFALKLFGKTTVILEGVPVEVKPGDEGTILQQMLDLYKEDGSDLKLEPRERLAKSYSCRAAIKKGDRLSLPEMQSLLDQLFRSAIPYVCPHGRPVIVKLSLSELDRRFGRTS